MRSSILRTNTIPRVHGRGSSEYVKRKEVAMARQLKKNKKLVFDKDGLCELDK